MEKTARRVEGVYALDTHIVIWAFERDMAQFSRPAFKVLEDATLLIPAFVKLEIVMMIQKKRLKCTFEEIESFLHGAFKIVSRKADVGDICHAAYPITWTRDPFDRLIVAESQLHAVPLVTKDRLIRSHYALAVW